MLSPPPVPESRSGGGYRMYRSVLGAHTCILVILGAFVALPLVGMSSTAPPTMALRLGIALVLLGVAADVLRRGERRGQVLVLAATFVVATPAIGVHPVPGDSTVGMVLSAVGIMAARLLPLVRAMVLVAVLAAVHGATIGVLGLPDAGLSVDSMVLVLGTAAAAVGFVNTLQASAIATDGLVAGNREREHALARSEAERAARSASRRVLHDDVLGTLHLVADGVAAPERTREQCRSTVEAIHGVVAAADAPEDAESTANAAGPGLLPDAWAALVAEVRDAAPVRIDLEVVGRAARLPEPTDEQRRALVRAASEGVRNAARHGRVDRVALRLSSDRRELRVEVLDRGAGPGRSPQKGFGLKESVERPLAGVGGRAGLLPRPDGGAALVLAVPRAEGGVLHHAYGLTTGGLGTVRTLPRTVALPLGAAWCLLALRSVALEPGTWPALLVGLGWLWTTAVIVRRAERGSPGPGWVAAVTAATLLLQVAGIALLPAGAMLDFRSWSIGMSAVPLVVFVLSLPLPVGAAVVLSHVALVLVASLLRPELTGGLVPWGSLNAVITCPVPSMVLGTLIRRQGRAMREQHRRELALEHRRAAEEWQAAMTDLYFANVRREVLPWLESIADGRRDPVAADTVAEARLLAVSARDDLYAPGFFDDTLRSEVARFRSDGGAVELRAGLSPGGHARAIGRVLRDLLPVSAGRRIIVSPPAVPGEQVRISVVPAPAAEDLVRLEQRAEHAIGADVDPYRAVLLVDDLPGSG